MKLAKVTEFAGYAYDDEDGPQFVRDQPGCRGLVEHINAVTLCPDGSVSPDWGQENRRSGRWRITVEFEPEDASAAQEAAASPSPSVAACRVWEIFGGKVRLFEGGAEHAEYWDEDDATWRSGWGRWGTEDISDADERQHEAWLAACRAHRRSAPSGA